MHKLFKLKDRIIAKVFRILTLNVIFPRTYKKAAKKPVDPNKIVFVEIRLPAVSNSLKVIYDKLVSEYDFDVHLHFLLDKNNLKPIVITLKILVIDNHIQSELLRFL